jgi:hypothetical protein
MNAKTQITKALANLDRLIADADASLDDELADRQYALEHLLRGLAGVSAELAETAAPAATGDAHRRELAQNLLDSLRGINWESGRLGCTAADSGSAFTHVDTAYQQVLAEITRDPKVVDEVYTATVLGGRSVTEALAASAAKRPSNPFAKR